MSNATKSLAVVDETFGDGGPADEHEHLTADQARLLTDDINRDTEALWDKIIRAYHGRADTALGYNSWDTYCIGEFGAARLRIPREERAEMVTSLRQAGLTYRVIESATGISRSSAARAQSAPVPNGTPDAVTGVDGKVYPARKPRPFVVCHETPKPKTTPVSVRVENGPKRPPTQIEVRVQSRPPSLNVVNLEAERPGNHDSVISTRIAAWGLKVGAATTRSAINQPHIQAAMRPADVTELRESFTAAITDLQAALGLLPTE